MKPKEKSPLNTPKFYMFSRHLFTKNNKVIENITNELKNNKLHTKGYINGKKINKTIKFRNDNLRKFDLFPKFIH